MQLLYLHRKKKNMKKGLKYTMAAAAGAGAAMLLSKKTKENIETGREM